MKKLLFTLMLFCFIFSANSQAQEFRTLSGKKISYEDMVATPRAVLFLWATWCPSCRKEFKTLASDCPFFDGVSMWYVNVREDKDRVQDFIYRVRAAKCIEKRVILDKKASIAARFGISAIPTFVFLEYGQPLYKSYHLDKKLLKKIFKIK